MKKNYFFALFASLMLFVAIPAGAQSFTIDQLFGKWKFTADVEFTADATQTHKEQLSGDCDATISKDANYIAKIVGFAGSQNQQNINMIGAKEGVDMVRINNLNTPQLWNGLYLANVDGDNPYGYFNNDTNQWEVESYGPVYYVVDAVNGLITIPDFTVVTIANSQTDKKGTIIAKYTNVKMSLVEAESVQIADIAGEYNFEAGKGTWDTMSGSVIPAEFSISLAKKSENNKEYDATISIEGYNDVTLPATFNGVSLVLSYNDVYLDEENKIRFAPMYGPQKEGNIEFKATEKEGAFTLYGGFSFASDSIGKAKDEVTDSLIVNGKYHQWYTAGTLKLPEAASSFSWDGVYTVSVANPSSDIILVNPAENTFDWPAEFQMEVQYWEAIDAYYVTKIMGLDLYNINGGGWPLEVAPDGKSASIVLNGGNYKVALLKSNGDGTFLALVNQNNNNTSPIKLTLNEDGTVSVDPCFVKVYDIATKTFVGSGVVFYQNLTAKKYVEEEPEFELAGDYTLTATIDKYYNYDDVAFPAEFDVNIAYFDGSVYGMDSYYYIATFLGKNIAASNQMIKIGVLTAGQEYNLVTGGFCGTIVNQQKYYKFYDMNASENPVAMTVNEDGTISIANFYIKVEDYTAEPKTGGALYKNVVLTKKGADTAIENVVVENTVEGIFDMQGRQIDAITAPGLYIVNGKKVLVK